ncbi:hypothetical protein [Sandaracinus amylolyticus]|uniref:Tetratricopeptide repeat protein n=1 Tax=Sandaracinus amylolyticus TaxID=927083 RepID=A0A0F6YHD5_9BACT|nr:hypothetical protein [Sandaracinus amylolyticus]AKF05782.1 hypothetical protein DB32_002931 [Sandaracinus amylolyticus]
MSFWRRLFARRDVALEEARAAIERGAHDEAWTAALRSTSVDARRIASRAARARGSIELAVRLDRAADDPADTERLFDLAGALARSGELGAAITTLEDALAMSPFDAVLRSELAILLARAARPAESAATLALHPCLADDPGALFQFAWSSLLAGDRGAARECVPQLAEHDAARPLANVLAAALDRADAVPPPRDLRDWLFVEHGALLLDASAPRAPLDPDHVARVLTPSVVAALDAVGDRPRRIIVADDDRAHATELAKRLDVELVTARAGIPEGLLVVRDARELEPLLAHVAVHASVRTLAWTLDTARCALVADLVGTILHRTASAPELAPALDLERYVTVRAARLPPAVARTARPFAPDAPLAW